jgi:hypothetical protein
VSIIDSAVYGREPGKQRRPNSRISSNKFPPLTLGNSEYFLETWASGRDPPTQKYSQYFLFAILFLSPMVYQAPLGMPLPECVHAVSRLTLKDSSHSLLNVTPFTLVLSYCKPHSHHNSISSIHITQVLLGSCVTLVALLNKLKAHLL